MTRRFHNITNIEKYKNDNNFGLSNEDKLMSFLNIDNIDIYKKYDDKYSLFDLYNSEYICEVKTRRNCYNQYPTTMVGNNKLDICLENTDKKYRFYFIFTDGTYYWDFKEDEYNVFIGGRKDRGCKELKPYAFIPIDKLSLLTTVVKSVS